MGIALLFGITVFIAFRNLFFPPKPGEKRTWITWLEWFMIGLSVLFSFAG